MSRFLVKSEVEAHVSLAKGFPVLRYVHPSTTYTVILRDLKAEAGSDVPLLSALMIFEAPSLDDAKKVAESHLKEFLDYLTVVTNSKFRVHKILQIFDWEPGSASMRQCVQYTGFAHPDIPIPALNHELLETIAIMQQQKVPERVRRALKWFGNGVASDYSDDQFAYFWFVIEVMAQIVKELARVPDRCSVCSGPLFCPACGATHLHRPYPKQAIQQLFAKYITGDGGRLYAQASDVRNRLMHGDDVATIEAALKIDFSKLVDDLGRLAWVSIIDQFLGGFVGRHMPHLQTNRYVHMNVSMVSYMQFGFTPNFDDPHPDHLPKAEIGIEYLPSPEDAAGEGPIA